MTSIKPPIGPKGVGPQTATESPTETTSADFRGALDKATDSGRTTAAGTQGLAEAVGRGELSGAQAVEQMVNEAVRNQGLSASAASGLRAHLMGLLESDPTLAALVRKMTTQGE